MAQIYTTLFITIIMLTGCGSKLYKFTIPSEQQILVSQLHVDLQDENGTRHNFEYDSDTYKQLDKILEGSTCKIPKDSDAIEKSFAVELIPFATSASQLLFETYMNQKKEKIDKVKKSAEVTYSNRIIINSNQFRDKSCAILYRTNETNSPKSGLIAVLKFNKYCGKNECHNKDIKAFTISPVYVKVNDTVATTLNPEYIKGQNHSKINISFALSIKTIGEKNNLPTIIPIGQDVMSVHNLEIGTKGKVACGADFPCNGSDLIPYLDDDKNNTLSITFTITETGHIGDFLDQKTSEIKAIKEAIGPAIKESLQEFLKEDDKKQ